MRHVVFLSLILTVTSSNAQKPVFKCEPGPYDSCIFNNIILNSTHYEWQPTADDPNSVETVRFDDCVIPVITKGICEVFLNLEGLHISGVEAEELKEDAFDACTHLHTLRIGNNKIKTIHPKTFANTKNLADIDMGYNKIMNFKSNDIFANLPNLTALSLEVNNLTEFPSELVRFNKRIKMINLAVNDLADIEAEEIVDSLPEMIRFFIEDNEISCSRTVDILYKFQSRDMSIENTYRMKERYYPQEMVFREFYCNPDISWMASTYRKEKALVRERFTELSEKGDQNMLKLNEKMSKNDQQLEEITKQLNQMEEKFSKVEAEIQKLITFVTEKFV